MSQEIKTVNPKLTTICSSFSSLTRTQVVYEDLSIFMKNSLETSSNFFTSSPCTLVLPANPYLKVENKPQN